MRIDFEGAANWIEGAHDALLRVWLWALTMILTAFLIVIFSEFEAQGWIGHGAVESLRPVFSVMGLVSILGFALLLLASALSLGHQVAVWYRGRTQS